MSLLNNSNKGKGKKKGSQQTGKPGNTGNSLIPKGNSASKGSKSSRIASRSQRGS